MLLLVREGILHNNEMSCIPLQTENTLEDIYPEILRTIIAAAIVLLYGEEASSQQKKVYVKRENNLLAKRQIDSHMHCDWQAREKAHVFTDDSTD